MADGDASSHTLPRIIELEEGVTGLPELLKCGQVRATTGGYNAVQTRPLSERSSKDEKD
jgi:hypothetical protein